MVRGNVLDGKLLIQKKNCLLGMNCRYRSPSKLCQYLYLLRLYRKFYLLLTRQLSGVDLLLPRLQFQAKLDLLQVSLQLVEHVAYRVSGG